MSGSQQAADKEKVAAIMQAKQAAGKLDVLRSALESIQADNMYKLRQRRLRLRRNRRSFGSAAPASSQDKR